MTAKVIEAYPVFVRDSLDDPAHYSQAPPSYAEPSTSADNDALLGGPRSSEDNIPDDFKFGGSVAEATIEIRMQFVRKVYAILSVQLIATAALSSVSFFSKSYKDWIQSNTWMLWISMFGAIGFMLLTYWKRKSYPTNLLFLGGFTALEAYSISVIVSTFDSRIVLQAVLLTAGIFVALTLTVELIYSGIAALIFSGYILVDTQLIMRHYHVEEEIAAAISLYLDIINLFLAILRILNNQQNN
ncbi:hypothetical protein DID88_007215 [Monilinia fructigena]|uniref:Transmembrane BAX inhibitor motif-containing protein 4 n=1 Tax=Monilinia fructigena TaxID=38457 RepID=A0A395J7N1_9HELO|nr:hypothetical protein DID88_007215 [Monilinia fructigena]